MSEYLTIVIDLSIVVAADSRIRTLLVLLLPLAQVYNRVYIQIHVVDPLGAAVSSQFIDLRLTALVEDKKRVGRCVSK